MDLSAFRDDTTAGLVGLCRRHARDRASNTAYRWLRDGDVEDGLLTFADLDMRARAVASHLQLSHPSGKRALLLYPPGLEFIVAFLGCLYAGLTAVPVGAVRRGQRLSGLQRIAEASSAAVVLSAENVPEGVRCREDPYLGALPWLLTDGADSAAADEWREPAIAPDTLALLQYTSGSTGTPKGVAVSHGNLLHNQQMIAEAFGHNDSTVFVGWLPLYHDMGLIGNVLQPLYLGIPCTLMAPQDFIQRPVRWLRAISHYGASTSGAPNFAYELCTKRIPPEQRDGLDLSSWTVAYNGAEPIRADTLARFVRAFGPHGFRRSAFYPCYGLAEATLFVTGGLHDAEPNVATVDVTALEEGLARRTAPGAGDGRELVGCGRVWKDQRIVIVDPVDESRCEPDQIGEIWISGGSVARGYNHQLDESEPTFNGYLDDGEGPFLRTGDLGFLDGEELFVTGRLKDVMIIRGRNHYPQDIEWTVAGSHRYLRPGCGAAFTVDEGADEQRLVVVQEVRKEYLVEPGARGDAGTGELTDAAREAVAREHGLRLHRLVLIRPNSLLKTSSGKIRRRAVRDAYVAGALSYAVPEAARAMAMGSEART